MSSSDTKFKRASDPPEPAWSASEETELAAGQRLAAAIERDGPLAADRALAFLREVTRALAEAHAAGRLHGDIRPANVLVTPDGHARLVGFGRAGSADAGASEREGPLYYPPEAARGRRLDQRSDLFLLGATFYHALAGRPPFDSPDPEARALQYIRNSIPPLGQIAPRAPVALCCLLHKLLRSQPEERCQSAAEVLEALDRIEAAFRKTAARRAAAAPSPAAAAPPGDEAEPLTPAERAEAARKQQRLIALLCAAALLVVLGGVLVVLIRGRSPAATAAGDAAARSAEAQARRNPRIPAAGPAARPAPAAPQPPQPEPVLLDAAAARPHGDCKYEPGDDRKCIGYWYGESAYVTWEFRVAGAGKFEVEVVYAGDRGIDGHEFTVAVAEQELRGTVRQTGSWAKFVPLRLGAVTLPKAGTYTLTVRPLRLPPRVALMNLRAVNLLPLQK